MNVQSIVLDAGALIAIEADPQGKTASRCRVAAESGHPPILPTVVFAQVWRGSVRQHTLAKLRRTSVALPFTLGTADRAGRLLARSKSSDVVDAAVVIAAIEHDAAVLTSDPNDLARLADAAGYAIPLLTV